MKIALLLLAAILLNAQSVKWQGNYDKALKLAKEQNKKLLVLIVKGNSSKVIKEFFVNKKYIDKINKNFVSVIVLYGGRSSYPIEMYYTTKFPALFLVNPKTETFITEPMYGVKSFSRLGAVLNQ